MTVAFAAGSAAKADDWGISALLGDQTALITSQTAAATSAAVTYNNGHWEDAAEAVSTALNAGNVLSGEFKTVLDSGASWDDVNAGAGGMFSQMAMIGSQSAGAVSTATSQLWATTDATALNAGNVADIFGEVNASSED